MQANKTQYLHMVAEKVATLEATLIQKQKQLQGELITMAQQWFDTQATELRSAHMNLQANMITAEHKYQQVQSRVQKSEKRTRKAAGNTR